MKIFYAIFILIIISCGDKNQISNIPSLIFVGISRDSMIQGDLNQDSVIVKFSFEDGDGDLGWGSTSSEKDIFVVDKRTGLLLDQFKIPDIPDSNGEPISGSMEIRIYTTCCIFPNNIPPCTAPIQYPRNEIQFEIYAKDRSGNESNRIITNKILLICN
ncbi:MAG: hypothetical protein HOP11_14880 [Saprospiraceae bacterium]|nr:hypothetical protein [Saprospiraceae bacterium]